MSSIRTTLQEKGSAMGWSAAVGFAAAIVIGFNWLGFGFGWTLGSTAEKMAAEHANKAVAMALTPACVQRFQSQPDIGAKWAAYKKTDTWRRDTYLKDGGFATPVGATAPDSDVASECVTQLDAILKKQASK